MHLRLRILVSLFLLLPFYLSAQSFSSFENDAVGMKKTVLDNGLTVYIAEAPHASRIFGAVVVRAGGKYDPADATGMAHYLEHMLFKGTEELGTSDYEQEKVHLARIDSLYEVLGQTREPEARQSIQEAINAENIAATQYAIPNEFDRLIGSIGGQSLNAFTTEERIVYHNSFPSNQLQKWLDIYAHRFKNPVFRLFQSELETVYEEKNRAMDDFTFSLFRDFNAQLFRNHPYGRQDVLGETDHLKNPSLKKMREYYERYYVPNNMALILSGDLNAAEALPWIEATFGQLEPGNVPEYPDYAEAPFEGRDYFSGRYTPIGLGVAGYRTVPVGHPDEAALTVLYHLLSNDAQTGYLDKLTLEKEVMAAAIIPLAYQDHGAAMLFIVPKILRQRVKKAEAIVLEEVRRIQRGEFDRSQLETIRKNLRREYETDLESEVQIALKAAEAFSLGMDWDDVCRTPDRYAAVTEADVIRVAKEYFGEDYLFFHSKMGFPKKEKLDKPPYSPPQPPQERESAYAQYFKSLPSQEPRPHWIDFEKDFTKVDLDEKNKVYASPNPVNSIFRLTFWFGTSTHSNPYYNYAAEYMNVIGTAGQDVLQFKQSIDELGSSYLFSADKNGFYLRIEGFEENLEATLQLMSELYRHPAPDVQKVDVVKQEARTLRRIEKRSVGEIGQAAGNWVLFGQKSPWLNRLSNKEIQQLEPAKLMEAYEEATAHGVAVHYTGALDAEALSELLLAEFFKGELPAGEPEFVETEVRPHSEPTVYFLHRKDAIQSQVYFSKASLPYSRELLPPLLAFNEYFGTSMSSLVFQEIREFRSLAYSARAGMRIPIRPDHRVYLAGFIGCQGDKTNEAVDVMYSLIMDMPEKPERMDALRERVIQSAYAGRPGFRTLTTNVQYLEMKGYDTDPAQERLPVLKALTWDQIAGFYREAVQDVDAPLVIVITGDRRRVDMDALAEYGKVVEISEKDVIRF